jgi:hypothetical protein
MLIVVGRRWTGQTEARRGILGSCPLIASDDVGKDDSLRYSQAVLYATPASPGLGPWRSCHRPSSTHGPVPTRPCGLPRSICPPLLLRTTGFVHPTLFTLRRPLHLLCLLLHCLRLLHLLPRLLW